MMGRMKEDGKCGSGRWGREERGTPCLLADYL